MAAKIHNTATATQQGAPLPATRNKNRHFESLTLTTLTGRVSSVLVDGHTILINFRRKSSSINKSPEIDGYTFRRYTGM
jgi:hypothetical protein